MKESNCNNRSWKITELLGLIRLPLFYNAWFLLGVTVIPGAIGFLFWTVASRMYRAEDVGLGSVIIASASFVSSIAGMGTNFGLIRFLPESYHPRSLINSLINFNIFASLTIGVIFWLGIPLWAGGLKASRENLPLFLIFQLFLIGSTVGTTIRDCFMGFQKAIFSFYYVLLTNGIRFILLIAGSLLGIEGLVGSVTAGFLLVNALFSRWIIALVLPGTTYRLELRWNDVWKMIPYSGGNFLAILLNQLPQTIIPLITLNQMGPESSAYAYIALMVGLLLVSPAMSIALSAFAEGSKDRKSLSSNFGKAFAISMIITGFGSCVVALSAPWILGIFGPDYSREGTRLLQWIALGAPFNAAFQLYCAFLRIEKRILLLVIVNSILIALIISIIYFLLPIIGIAANGLSFALGNIILSAIVLLLKRKSILRWMVGREKK